MAEQPLVSVGIVTYNHRSYIAQALDSVLAQERDFSMEIVISDDRSTDGADLVIDGYTSRYPNLVHRIDPPQNIGAQRNFARVWEACAGKYIALLDGDDWWHSRDKLATQIAFMESHPDCTLCGHGVQVARPDGSVHFDEYLRRPELADGIQYVAGCYLVTCSVLFRGGIVTAIPSWLFQLKMGDWPLGLLHAVKGKIGYVHRALSTYRLHDGGIWSPLSLTKKHEQMLEALLAMRDHFPATWQRAFDASIAHLHFQQFLCYRDEGRYLRARWHMWRHCVHRFAARSTTADMLYKVPLRMIWPGIRRWGGCSI